MVNYELVNLAGFRLDGRIWNEYRKVSISHEDDLTCEGSVVIKQGLTHVRVSVRGPSDSIHVRQANQPSSSSLTISSDINVARNMSTDICSGIKLDSIISELSYIINKIYKSVIIMPLSKRSHIAFIVDVLDADGSLKSSIINGCTLALVDAGVALRSLVFSTTVCYLDTLPLADPTHVESKFANANLTIATDSISKNPVYIDMDSRISLDAFKKMYDLCVETNMNYIEYFKERLYEHAEKTVNLNELAERMRNKN